MRTVRAHMTVILSNMHDIAQTTIKGYSIFELFIGI